MVIKLNDSSPAARGLRWECRCDCGATGFVSTSDLRNGYSRQCVKCGQAPRDYKEELDIVFWNRMITNANKRDIKILISKEQAYQLYLKQNRKCALTGLAIRFPKNGSEYTNGQTTASLDRIDSLKPYQIDNIQWLHKDVNRMKNIYTQERFLEICKLVTNNN
jgi:hypothetical protein